MAEDCLRPGFYQRLLLRKQTLSQELWASASDPKADSHPRFNLLSRRRFVRLHALVMWHVLVYQHGCFGITFRCKSTLKHVPLTNKPRIIADRLKTGVNSSYTSRAGRSYRLGAFDENRAGGTCRSGTARICRCGNSIFAFSSVVSNILATG